MTSSLATIGLMYIDGKGCTKDEEAGIQWLRKSLEGGSVYGTGMLSYQYFTRKLFSKAAECAHKYVPHDCQPVWSVQDIGKGNLCFSYEGYTIISQ